MRRGRGSSRLGASRPDWLESLETAAPSLGRWLFLLWSWIFARNLLESLLAPPRVLGFDWRGEISFGMVFLHFPLFYFVLFLGLVLLLHLLLRRPIERVASAVAIGFGVILVPPIVDGLLYPGRGVDLGYMMGFGGVLWEFWHPTATLAAVSAGQRIEIVLAMLMVLGYGLVAGRAGRECAAGPAAARAATRRRSAAVGLALGLLAAVGLFLWSAFLGAWPSLLAKMTCGAQSGGYAERYLELVRGPGLIANESRRHALLFVPWALVGWLLLLQRWRPRHWSWAIRRLRWSRLIHYTGMVPGGFLLGWVIYSRHMSTPQLGPTDGLAAASAWLAMVGAYLAAWAWNAHYDREGDRLNAAGTKATEANRCAAQEDGPGEVECDLEKIAWAAAAAAAVVALMVSYQVFLLVGACLILAWAYSVPPLRLKRWPLISSGTLALLSVLSLATGFALFAQEMTLHVIPSRVVLMLGVGITLGFTAKDLKDVRGDRATGVVTIATLLPARVARLVTAILVAIGYAAAVFFGKLGVVHGCAAAVAATLSVVLMVRLKRPDTALLVIFMLFAAFSLLLIAREPESVMPEGAESLAAAHAVLRENEDVLRRWRLLREGAWPASPAPDWPSAVAALGRIRGSVAAAAGRSAAESVADGHAAGGRCAGGRGAGCQADWGERLAWNRALAAGYGTAAAEEAWDLISYRPLDARHHSAVLQAAIRTGEIDRGIAICDRTLEKGIRPGDFARHRAALMMSRGSALTARQWDLIARDLAAAHAWGQEPTQVWLLSGDYHRMLGRDRDAREAYDRALLRDPTLADAYAGLGEVSYAAGDLDGAVEQFLHAYARAPEDPWILNNLGVVLRDRGDLETAREMFTRAHALDPSLFEPLYNLGDLAERRGRREEARGWYQQAATLRPVFGPVLEALRRVAVGTDY